MGTELKVDAGAILGHFSDEQRQRLYALDVAYIELLSGDVVDKTDVEALAEAVVAFYDGLAASGVGHENGA